MQRILERGEIERLAQRAIPRIRLPDPGIVFATRARRLRELGEREAIGHSIADYLELMAQLADMQQVAAARFEGELPGNEWLAEARTHGMPPIQASGWPRESRWREVLRELCDGLAVQRDLPAGVRQLLDRLRRSLPEELERQADALLTAGNVDIAAAPFIMGALQVCWMDLASRLPADAVGEPAVPGLCPMCGSLPVSSIVRADRRSQGYRYLHCGLCATEWHMVRVTCSQCQSTKGITYRSIEGGSEAVRAECCDSCRTYRKIFYEEKDSRVEPVADDLASLALDLLLGEAGYHRASGNPLLRQA